MFGETLKRLRIERGLSQEELANIIGVAKSTISMYELGSRIPKADATLKKLAQYFNVTIDYILGLSENRFREPYGAEDSIISDLKTAFKIQELEKIRMQQAANTYTIHGSNGNGAVIITSDIPKEKYLLIGEGEASELTKSQYSALKGVLEAMSSNWEDK